MNDSNNIEPHNTNDPTITNRGTILNAAKTMRATSSYQNSIANFIKSGSNLSALAAFNSANAHQNSIANFIKNSSSLSALAAFNAANLHHNSIANFIKNSSSLSALAAFNAANLHHNSIANSIKNNSNLSSIAAFSASNLSQQSIAEIMNKSSFRNAIDAFAKPANLLATLDLIARAKENIFIDELPETEFIDEKLELQFQEIGKAKDSDSVAKAFSKLSPAIKAVLLFFILQLLAVTQNIVANIITPHVEKLISDSTATEKEKIKQLKSFSLDELNLKNLRFVTTEGLLLRENPSTKSTIKDELRFGQVVTVINKQRNWMEISYEYENGEIMQGWVFSRYTAKFQK